MKKAVQQVFLIILSILYGVTFYLTGMILYYLSKVFKMVGHALMLEPHSAREEWKTFRKHFTNLGDL